MNPSSMHLWKAAHMLPIKNHSFTLLKSYYLTKLHGEIASDIKQFSDEKICKKCSTPWSDVQFSMRVKPVSNSVQQSRKILTHIGDKSNPKKHQIARKSAKKVNNSIQITCHVCNYKKSVVLWKQPSASAQLSSGKVTAVEDSNIKQPVDLPPSSKKRKRNKDKTAGLKIPPPTCPNNRKMHLAPITFVSQSFQAPQLNNKLSNLDKSATNKKATIKMTVPKNTVTNVQKKNSLLHLANALKMKNKANPVKDNKLEKLLR